MIWAAIYALVLAAVTIIVALKAEHLGRREEGLEQYARDLEDWETKYSVRMVALTNMFRYAKRLGDEDPLLKERIVSIEKELFPGE